MSNQSLVCSVIATMNTPTLFLAVAVLLFVGGATASKTKVKPFVEYFSAEDAHLPSGSKTSNTKITYDKKLAILPKVNKDGNLPVVTYKPKRVSKFHADANVKPVKEELQEPPTPAPTPITKPSNQITASLIKPFPEIKVQNLTSVEEFQKSVDSLRNVFYKTENDFKPIIDDRHLTPSTAYSASASSTQFSNTAPFSTQALNDILTKYNQIHSSSAASQQFQPVVNQQQQPQFFAGQALALQAPQPAASNIIPQQVEKPTPAPIVFQPSPQINYPAQFHQQQVPQIQSAQFVQQPSTSNFIQSAPQPNSPQYQLLLQNIAKQLQGSEQQQFVISTTPIPHFASNSFASNSFPSSPIKQGQYENSFAYPTSSIKSSHQFSQETSIQSGKPSQYENSFTYPTSSIKSSHHDNSIPSGSSNYNRPIIIEEHVYHDNKPANSDPYLYQQSSSQFEQFNHNHNHHHNFEPYRNQFGGNTFDYSSSPSMNNYHVSDFNNHGGFGQHHQQQSAHFDETLKHEFAMEHNAHHPQHNHHAHFDNYNHGMHGGAHHHNHHLHPHQHHHHSEPNPYAFETFKAGPQLQGYRVPKLDFSKHVHPPKYNGDYGGGGHNNHNSHNNNYSPKKKRAPATYILRIKTKKE